MKVYTIEFGEFIETSNGTYQHCMNQPSFLDIKKANKEISIYLKNIGFMFREYDGRITSTLSNGFYIELYENEVTLDKHEIKEIKQHANYPDGTSLSTPIKRLYVDCSGEIVILRNIRFDGTF